MAAPQEIELAAEVQDSLESFITTEPNFAELLGDDTTQRPRDERGRFAAAPLEGDAPAQPAENAPEGESQPAEAEAEAEDDALRTLDQVAEAFGVDSDTFLSSIQVRTGEEDEGIPLAEVISGYQRGGPEIAPEEVTARIAEFDRLEAERRNGFAQQMQELSQHAAALMQSIQPEREPNWDQLARENPTEFHRIWSDWQTRHRMAQQAMQAINAATDRQRQIDQQNMQRAQAEFRKQEEARLRAATRRMGPEWTENGGTAAQTRLENHLLSLGFTKDEIDQNLVDHREKIIAWQAARYAELSKKATEIRKGSLKGVPRIVPAQARVKRESAPAKALDNQFTMLEQSGRVEDAVGLLTGFIEDE